jgi:hypothetical protein
VAAGRRVEGSSRLARPRAATAFMSCGRFVIKGSKKISKKGSKKRPNKGFVLRDE